MDIALEGAFAKSIRTLSSSEIQEPSMKVELGILEKRPKKTTTTDVEQNLLYDTTLPPMLHHKPFTLKKVMKEVQNFHGLSAAVGSGMSPNHLIEITNAGADRRNSQLNAMAAGLDAFTRGEAQPKMA